MILKNGGIWSKTRPFELTTLTLTNASSTKCRRPTFHPCFLQFCPSETDNGSIIFSFLFPQGMWRPALHTRALGKLSHWRWSDNWSGSPLIRQTRPNYCTGKECQGNPWRSVSIKVLLDRRLSTDWLITLSLQRRLLIFSHRTTEEK